MKQIELKLILQRIVAKVAGPDDALVLAREVDRLRGALTEVRDMTGDPAVIQTIELALRD